MDRRLDDKWVWAAAGFLAGALACAALLDRLQKNARELPAAAGTGPDPNSKPDPRVGPDPTLR